MLYWNNQQFLELLRRFEIIFHMHDFSFFANFIKSFAIWKPSVTRWYMTTPAMNVVLIFVPTFPTYSFQRPTQSISVNFTTSLLWISPTTLGTMISLFGDYIVFQFWWKQLFENGLFFSSFLARHVFRFIHFNLQLVCSLCPCFNPQHSTRKHCLQISGLRMRSVTWNRFPIFKHIHW